MNESSLTGILLGVLGVIGLSYLAVKVRQNQRRLHWLVGIVDERHVCELQYLFDLADSGELRMYGLHSGA